MITTRIGVSPAISGSMPKLRLPLDDLMLNVLDGNLDALPTTSSDMTVICTSYGPIDVNSPACFRSLLYDRRMDSSPSGVLSLAMGGQCIMYSHLTLWSSRLLSAKLLRTPQRLVHILIGHNRPLQVKLHCRVPSILHWLGLQKRPCVR